MTSIKKLLKWGQKELSASSETANLDAEILLCHLLEHTRIYLYSHPESSVKSETESSYKQLIKSRKTGYPIAYLTGNQAFWTLELEVNEHTLIPRPETELLVELGLENIKMIDNPIILDLGTGSGAIALAIASERPDASIIAVDQSYTALQMARKNQLRYELNQVEFLCASWFDAIASDSQFDLILTNPPYIAENDAHLVSNIRYEPQTALISGPQGLDDIAEIISKSTSFLKPGGWLYIEHGYDQKYKVQDQFKQLSYHNIHTWQDHAGIDRVSGGQK